VQEIAEQAVEEGRLLEVERVGGVGQDRQPAPGNPALQEEAGLKATFVLVPNQDQRGRRDGRQLVAEIEQRWPSAEDRQ
jgi:hypothetical protein